MIQIIKIKQMIFMLFNLIWDFIREMKKYFEHHDRETCPRTCIPGSARWARVGLAWAGLQQLHMKSSETYLFESEFSHNTNCLTSQVNRLLVRIFQRFRNSYISVGSGFFMFLNPKTLDGVWDHSCQWAISSRDHEDGRHGRYPPSKPIVGFQ